MKKTLAIILCVILALQMIPFSALAQEFPDGDAVPTADMADAEQEIISDELPSALAENESSEKEDDVNPVPEDEPTASDFSYTIDNGQVTITGYTGENTEVVIPDTIEDCPVTAIGNGAFRNNVAIAGVTISDNVTSIGYAAFTECSGLTNLVIGNGVKSIGQDAFSGCGGLTKVSIPDSVNIIGESAFCGCTGLTEVTIGNSVRDIGERSFCGCTELTEITIPESVTRLGMFAFQSCEKLATVYYNAASADVYSSVMDYLVFHLAGIDSGTGITAIIGTTVKRIPAYLFYNCTALSTVTIPKNVVSIEEYAFCGCTGLTMINYDASAATDVTAASKVFYNTGTEGGGVKVVFGTHVERIPSYLFYNCTSLLTATIPDAVKSIGSGAFFGCSGLTEVTLPNSVSGIERYAFSACTGLTSVTISNRRAIIDDNAFDGVSSDMEICAFDCSTAARFAREHDLELHSIGTAEHVIDDAEQGTVTNQATCEEDGLCQKTCTICGLSVDVVLPALGHDWGAPEYVWAADNKTVTATRTCRHDASHKESEEAAVTTETKAPTCEENGVITYTAVFENDTFETQTKTVAGEDALGHDWSAPVYGWSSDYSQAMAVRTCKNDPSHAETEVVASVSEITKAATCTAPGETTYTATFTNPAFSSQTKTVADIPMAEHTAGEAVRENEKAATCTEDGSYDEVICCTVCGMELSRKTTETLPATGHEWGPAVYGWSSDNTTVTAYHTCVNDSSHFEIELVNTTSEITKPATCEEKGETTYTAAFTKDGFAPQTKTADNIPATGHTWGEPVWTWSDDYSVATVTFVCTKDSKHVWSRQATVTSVTVDPTATADGSVTYTATAEGPDGTQVTDTKVKTLPPSGYTYDDPVYTWTEIRDETGAVTGYQVEAVKTCREDPARTITETATAGYSVATPAGCETAGEGVWTAIFSNDAFETQTRKEPIPAAGHSWGGPVWSWSEDKSTATATFTCEKDAGHVRTLDADMTSETQAATAAAPGKTTYTASVTFEGKTYTDSQEIEIPVLDTVYTLTYDANGGTGAPEAQTVTSNTLSAEFTLSTVKPTRAGYNFKGWAETNDAAAPMTETSVTLTYPETSKVLYAVWEVAGKPAFKSQTLVLSGQIGVNFFLELPEIDGVDYSESYMTFTIGKDDTVFRDDFDPNHMNANRTRYGFTCYVNSLQMADTIKAVFHYGNDKTVTKDYYVASYIEFFDKNIGSFNDKTIALIRAIADFGHYEQIYLASVNHWTIGQDYAEMAKHYTDSYNYADILAAVADKAFVKELGESKVNKATYKLHLDSTTTVDVYLTPEEGVEVTASAAFNGKTYSAEKQEDGRYLVRITDISAHQLGDMITITGDAEGAFTVRVSALSYVRSVLANNTTKAEKDGMCALYAYYAAVLAYRQ